MIVTVFRARLRADGPGACERASIVEFKDQANQKAWATQVAHVAAKKTDRSSLYAEYAIQVCQIPRESRFVAPQAGPDA